MRGNSDYSAVFEIPGVGVHLLCTLPDVRAVAVVVGVGEAEDLLRGSELQGLDPVDVDILSVSQPDRSTELVIEQPELVRLRHPGTEGQTVSADNIVTDSRHTAAVSIGRWSEIWPPIVWQSETIQSAGRFQYKYNK